jgi:hypothetical protein
VRELIRHILKESRLQQELKQVIEDGNIFDAADMVGGLNNLKKIFKGDPKFTSLFEKLTGTITFYYIGYLEFPLEYEIIGRRSNVHNTNHWPEINVLYDENKLTPEENEVFKEMIKYLVDEVQHSGFGSKLNDSRLFNANYLTVAEINGQDIDSIDYGYDFSNEDFDVKNIHNKLYVKSESLNESDNRETDKKLKLVKEMIYSLFDEVEFIEVDTNYEGKPLIEVYHDVENTAANYDNWFTHRIIDEIKEMTGDGVVLAPWWALGWDWKYKNPDIYIQVQKIDYDDEGNVINESEEKQPKYLNIIKDLVEPFKDEDGVCDIRVSYDDDDDMYSVYIVMGTEEMNDKFFYVPMIQSHISKLRINVRNIIKDYLPIDNLYVGSYGKPNCKWNPINESSIKEKSLIKLIEKDGLYDFVEMTGLDFNQVRSLLKHTDNPKEILKQYIREFVLEHDGMSNGDYGSLFALRLPLSNTKYVNDIMVQDRDQIAVEIWGYEEDEYGHTEQTEQYLTSINNLTNEELLSILSWMMETIEGGYWD